MYMYMYVCWTFRVVIVKACTEQSQEMHHFKVWFLCFTCAMKTLIFSKGNLILFNPGLCDCVMCSAISND